MQPRWSSIWLLLIRVSLWQRNFPLLRQFALFIELQRANRHPGALRGWFCSGWRAEGTTGAGWAKGLDGYTTARTEFWDWEGWRVIDPEVHWKHFCDLRPAGCEDMKTWWRTVFLQDPVSRLAGDSFRTLVLGAHACCVPTEQSECVQFCLLVMRHITCFCDLLTAGSWQLHVNEVKKRAI